MSTDNGSNEIQDLQPADAQADAVRGGGDPAAMKGKKAKTEATVQTPVPDPPVDAGK